ncbi:MAG: hypothetical protein FD159_1340 [Syntrophaceae bacterium]|nr:MAG: hypothetical protein FD159_1340 [Syntrophaceae bacterium]
MKKLNKRQIIILAITALVALYAAYDLLIAGSMGEKTKIEAKPAEIESFVNAIRNDLVKTKTTSEDIYIATRAEMEWSRSPFWEKTSYLEFVGKETSGVVTAKIIYSGYVEAGRKKMAIINGWEYEAGESLDIEGYSLKSISPSRVLIVNRNTFSELSVPIQE